MNKEDDLKAAIKKVGGSLNKRGCFLKTTSQESTITKASGVIRASVAFLPLSEVEEDTVKHLTSCEFDN